MKKNTNLELVLRTFLEEMKVNPSSMSFAKSLDNHPDPYSLIAISDILNEKNISNSSFLLPESELDKLLELPTPFISLTTEGGFIVVKKVTDSIVEYYSSIIGEIKEEWSVFQAQCSGVVLLAFPDKNTLIHERSSISHFFEKFSPYFLLLLFSLALSGIIANFYFLYNNLSLFILLAIKSIGLILTILLFLLEYKKSESFVEELCKVTKTDCKKVINNKDAKFLGLISWSELGLIYFIGSLLSVFMSHESVFSIINSSYAT